MSPTCPDCGKSVEGKETYECEGCNGLICEDCHDRHHVFAKLFQLCNRCRIEVIGESRAHWEEAGRKMGWIG